MIETAYEIHAITSDNVVRFMGTYNQYPTPDQIRIVGGVMKECYDGNLVELVIVEVKKTDVARYDCNGYKIGVDVNV